MENSCWRLLTGYCRCAIRRSLILERKWPPDIMDKKRTLDYILESGCSVGRFGDGEASLMVCVPIGFQKASLRLRKELIEIARQDDPGFLVCIPLQLIDKSQLTPDARKWWDSNLKLMGRVWRRYFSNGAVFGDTEITRPWIATQNIGISQYCFDSLERLWEGKDILIIEGEKSRVGVGNNFFCKAKSISRILCPPKNAYSHVDDIFRAAVQFPKSSLILLALGPTATVLAYRLYKEGYRTIDIGHLDIEYEWFRMRTDRKVPIVNKFVNEAGGDKTFKDELMDKEYLDQIKARIR